MDIEFARAGFIKIAGRGEGSSADDRGAVLDIHHSAGDIEGGVLLDDQVSTVRENQAGDGVFGAADWNLGINRAIGAIDAEVHPSRRVGPRPVVDDVARGGAVGEVVNKRVPDDLERAVVGVVGREAGEEIRGAEGAIAKADQRVVAQLEIFSRAQVEGAIAGVSAVGEVARRRDVAAVGKGDDGIRARPGEIGDACEGDSARGISKDERSRGQRESAVAEGFRVEGLNGTCGECGSTGIGVVAREDQ